MPTSPDPPVRIGLIGLGSFGRQHAHRIQALSELKLVATCDPAAGSLTPAAEPQHNQRMNPAHQRLKQLLEAQRLGRLQRIHWNCTPWFRTQAYYRSASWRGTWAGEGGGLLMTLCLHQLDILQWLCGLPTSLQAFGAFGRHHDIEVEDEVTAYLQFPGGASGVFVGSSGEWPGTNRLELVGTGGRVLLEDGTLSFVENEVPSDEFIRASQDGWAQPKTRVVHLPVASATEGEHSQILRNFARAIRGRETLLIPAKEGLGSLELAGAMLLSMFHKRAVELPLDAADLATELERRTATSAARP